MFKRFIGAIGRGLSKIPSLLGRGATFAQTKVVPAVRKVGEVASVISRGIGEEAPEGLRKIGSIAQDVGARASQIAGGIEKGAKIGGEIAKALAPEATSMPMPETEASAQQVEGGAMYGLNNSHSGKRMKQMLI